MFGANPYYPQIGMSVPMQQPRMELTKVSGLDGAKAYQMPPNSTAALFDAGADVFYVKRTDGAGFPTITAYSFTAIQQNAATDMYVTHEQLE